ncbi:hypothetical protein WA026_015528 [Henosepilachna vigintioctopunctata]|uniref:Uncharacterized protein n=1 Tax=Henosepilachna vigintioctopunctata TaxID=420089 RepID=A0AAW1VH51_9CUCU
MSPKMRQNILESPDEKTGFVVRLPGIREDNTPSPAYSMSQPPELVYTGISLVGQIKTPVKPSTSFADTIANPASCTSKLYAPSTPRIDISRASSSSHHDSKESSPDRELAGENYENRDQGTTKLGVGFGEDGTLDLRLSTEELDFQEKDQDKRKSRSRPQSPACLNEESYQNHVRKDSQCSEISLLAISGRTSRLSSIGSAGSAQSRLSNASHLSVLSGATELSRSPSPHKMLLETSFCGTKTPQSTSSTNIDKIGTKTDSDDLEKILLSRVHDPTEAILAEGITVKKEGRCSSMKQAPEKPARRIERRVQSVKSDITIKVDNPSVHDSNITPRPTKKIISESGIEYIYIPLKGPLPLDFEENKDTSSKPISKISTSSKSITPKSNMKSGVSPAPTKILSQSKSGEIKKPRDVSSRTKEIPTSNAYKTEEPKYIRIKLKPDHLYDDDDTSNTSTNTKAEKIDLDEIRTDDSTTGTYDTGKSLTSTPSMSPKFTRHIRDPNFDSKTPSPSVSRRSSFASIFRSKEAITSPESPTVPGKKKSTITGVLREASETLREKSGKRSRSKSRDRDRPLAVSNAPSSTESIDSRGKTKSVFSIFKSSKGDSKKAGHISPEVLSDKIAKVEFKFNDDQTRPIFEKPLEGNSIRIPLHSPTHYENDNHLNLKDIQTPSQDSQDTVIEVLPVKKEEIQDNSNQTLDTCVKKTISECQSRQSSTSSENVVFSTKVGSNNEIFTTKLPKEKKLDKLKTKIEETKLENDHIDIDQTQESKPATDDIVDKIQVEAKVENWTEDKIERTRSTTSLGKILEENQKPILSEKEINIIKSGLVEPETTRQSLIVDDDRNNSSESEKDSEASSIPCNIPKQKNEPDTAELLEPECNSLVVQDSFEDEFPYVPTTLPLERSAAIPIVPVKQRATFEMKTCPIDRPRSTTPINPSSLDDYCEDVVSSINTEQFVKSIEKLKISLPRSDSSDKTSKSPKKPRNTTWFEFAEKGIHTGRKSSTEGDTPPPLPPKGVQKEWINFEEVPERRKLPKRIQTIPSRGHMDVPDSLLHDHVVYNYVNPDECKCECHEKKEKMKEDLIIPAIQDDEIPLLENELDEDKIISTNLERIKLDTIADRGSLISDSSVDLSTAVDQHELTQADVSLQTPFKTDLDVASNRSSIVSLEEPRSPFSETPNAFSRPS